jgi:activator of HSP90 ATPase
MLLNTSLSKNRITVGSKSFQTLENTGMFGSKTVTGNVMRNMRATTKAQR